MSKSSDTPSTPVDQDLAEQAKPGHGIPSQDPDPAAQHALRPEEAEREANSALMGGGVMVGAAAGAAVGGVVGGPLGLVVGGTIGAVAGTAGGAAAGALVKPAPADPSAPAPVDPTEPPSADTSRRP